MLADMIVRIGASLPAAWKGAWNLKIMNRFMNLSGIKKRKEFLATNLGISPAIRVSLPAGDAPATMFFGGPKEYLGEYYTMMLTLELSKHCDATADIGANWGFYTYFLASKGVKPIYWFEPNAALNKTIHSNVLSNGFAGIEGSDFALAAQNGQLTFYIDKHSDLESSLIEPKGRNDIEAVTVNATRFDSWVEQKGLSASKLMVKVDVENAEWEFVNGASGCVPAIQFLILEILGPARQGRIVDHIVNVWGLNAYYINGQRLEFVREDDMRYTKGEYNWLFTHESPENLKSLLATSVFEVIA